MEGEMGFVKTYEEIAGMQRETGEFYEAQMLSVVWETKPAIVKRLLPPPLEPAERPLALAFVAYYPKTNFGVTYYEAALFLHAQFGGEVGLYCLSMPVTNDMAMAGGREIYGYPKKIASIELNREGQDVAGWAERHEVRFLDVRAKLNGKFNTEGAQNIFSELLSSRGDSVVVTFNFKHFPAPEGGAFDYSPRLVREEVEFRPYLIEGGEAEIILNHSPHDPWAEVEVVKTLGAIYTQGNNTMRKGKVVAEVDPIAFAPFAFLKWDA
jgi:acetoacetate decarboxylase